MEIIEIPNKSAFKLNEVCSITGVKPYVLRFWESEFDEIGPMTSSTGQKLFGPRDIEVIATIKDLLFNQKMSIEEARFNLKQRLDQSNNAVLESEDEFLENKNDHSDFEADDFPPRVPRNLTNDNDQNLRAQEAISLQRISLSDDDLEKLVMAKGLLQEIVSHQSLQ